MTILANSFIRMKRAYMRTKPNRLIQRNRGGGEDHDPGYIGFNERRQ